MKCRLPIGPPCSHPCIRSSRLCGTPAANPSLSPRQLRRTPYLFIAKTCLFQEEKVQNLNPIVDIGDRNDKSHVAETRILIGVDKNCITVIRKVANVTLRKYSSQSHVGVSQCSCARGSQDETRQFKGKTVIPAPPDSSRSYPSTLPSIASTLTKRGGMPRIKTVTSSSHFLKLCIIRNLNRYQDSRSQH